MEKAIKLDIEAYFKRINYSQKPTATLETLADLHRLHTQAIPFENISPFLGEEVSLDPLMVFNKLVLDKRGGYCFEQNALFSEVLTILGFQLKGLAARVVWNRSDAAPSARSHRLLLVTIDDRDFIADVGFGGITLTSPLEFKTDREQKTTHEDFRMRIERDFFILEVKILNEWKPLYTFDLQEQFTVDYEISNFYVSQCSTSIFTKNLLAARPFETGRYALRNNTFTTHYLNGTSESRKLKAANEIKEVLTEKFLIKLPVKTIFDKKLENLLVENI
jgi:N-hydroxyarylamine O-acetyltransferase